MMPLGSRWTKTLSLSILIAFLLLWSRSNENHNTTFDLLVHDSNPEGTSPSALDKRVITVAATTHELDPLVANGSEFWTAILFKDAQEAGQMLTARFGEDKWWKQY